MNISDGGSDMQGISNIQTILPVGEWDATKTYALGSLAYSKNILWVSLQDNNLNHGVGDRAWWKRATISPYRTGITYEQDDMCTYGDKIWVCRRSANGQTPFDLSTYWYKLGNKTIYDRASQNTDSNLRPYAFSRTGGLPPQNIITMGLQTGKVYRIYCQYNTSQVVFDVATFVGSTAIVSSGVHMIETGWDFNSPQWEQYHQILINFQTGGEVAYKVYSRPVGGTWNVWSGSATMYRIDEIYNN